MTKNDKNHKGNNKEKKKKNDAHAETAGDDKGDKGKSGAKQRRQPRPTASLVSLANRNVTFVPEDWPHLSALHGLGIPVVPASFAKISSNHPVCHVIRDYITKSLVPSLVAAEGDARGVPHVLVADWCGRPDQAAPFGCRTQHGSGTDFSIRYAPVQGGVWGSDLSRQVHMGPTHPGPFQCMMSVDIYHYTNELLEAGLAHTTWGLGYLVYHVLDERLGAHVFSDGKSVHTESAWYTIVQDGRELRVFRGDPQAKPYPPHEALDFHRRTAVRVGDDALLSFYEVARVGPYAVVRVARHEGSQAAGWQPTAPIPELNRRFGFEARSVWSAMSQPVSELVDSAIVACRQAVGVAPDWDGKADAVEAVRGDLMYLDGYAWIDWKTVHEVTRRSMTVSVTGLRAHDLAQSITDRISNDPELAAVDQFHRGIVTNLIQNTLLIVTGGSREVEAAHVLRAARNGALAREMRKEAVKGPEPVQKLNWAYIGVACGLLIWQRSRWASLIKKLSGFFGGRWPRVAWVGAASVPQLGCLWESVTGHPDFQSVVVGGPVVEETLRGWAPRAMSAGFVALEVAAQVWLGRPITLSNIALHSALSTVASWKVRVAAHAVHNALVLALDADPPRRGWTASAGRASLPWWVWSGPMVAGAGLVWPLAKKVWSWVRSPRETPLRQPVLSVLDDMQARRASEGVGVHSCPGPSKIRDVMTRATIPENLAREYKTVRVRMGDRTMGLVEAINSLQDNLQHVDNCTCNLTGRCDDCSAARADSWTYSLIMTNGTLIKPRGDPYSFLRSLLSRVYRDCTPGALLAKGGIKAKLARATFFSDLEDFLRPAYRWITEQLQSGLENELTHSDVIGDLRGAARAAYSSAVPNVENGSDSGGRAKMNGKYNEHIKRMGSLRMIMAMAAGNQVITQRVMREFTRLLKLVFDGTPREFATPSGTVTVAVNLPRMGSPDVLSKIANRGPADFEMAVCGDDLLRGGTPGHINPSVDFDVEEWDYGKYDVTQYLPHFTSSLGVFVALGAPREFIAGAEKALAARYRAKLPAGTPGEHIEVVGARHVQQVTGWAGTYTFGSLHNIGMNLAAIYHGVSLQEACERWGWIVTGGPLQQREGATFLKLMVTPRADGEGLTMAPLLGAVLKVTKVLTSPSTMIKGPYTEDLRSAFVLSSLLDSMGLKEPLYDIRVFGALRRLADSKLGTARYGEVYERHRDRVMSFAGDQNPYKPVCQELWREVDWEAYCSLTQARYSVSRDEIEEVHEMILDVPAFPWFLSHRLFERLALVDYS